MTEMPFLHRTCTGYMTFIDANAPPQGMDGTTCAARNGATILVAQTKRATSYLKSSQQRVHLAVPLLYGLQFRPFEHSLAADFCMGPARQRRRHQRKFFNVAILSACARYYNPDACNLAFCGDPNW